MWATGLPAGRTSHRSTPRRQWTLRGQDRDRREIKRRKPTREERGGYATGRIPSAFTFQEGLLLLGRADEPADAFNDLAL